MSEEEATLVAPLVRDADAVVVPLACDSWNRDLSPWPARRAFPKGEDFTGGAEAFLRKLTSELIPRAESGLMEKPERRYLCGYSLAGLFSVYAATLTDLFDGIASMSGSLWFDGFTEYVRAHPVSPKVRKAYFSLGSKEKNARDPRMRLIEEKTRETERIFREQDVKTCLELNPGGHFNCVPERIGRGIRWLAESAE